MPETLKSYTLISDFVTGKMIPNVGAEENRQAVERFLVNEKGYSKEEIEIDADIVLTVAGETYRSQIDLVVRPDNGPVRFMVIKCVAASLGSREREIVSAARLLEEDYQIPFAVVSDGKTAIVLDTVSGKTLGDGMSAIPSRNEARSKLASLELRPYPQVRLEREKLVFRAYDRDNVNVSRNLS